MKIFALLAGVFGLLGVAAGAFGSHGLADQVDPGMLDVFEEHWELGVQYQMYHAVALLGVAWLYQQTEAMAALVAGWSFTAGILVFSGSLYVLVLTGIRGLGALTPVGGVALMAGWIGCILAALKLGS